MKFPVIHVPFLPVAGMAVFPFILIKKKSYKHDKIFINHEYIHLRQQLELLILPFYLFYLINYLYNLIRYKNHHTAYFQIVFEKEAYTREKDLKYPAKRRFWNWMSLHRN